MKTLTTSIIAMIFMAISSTAGAQEPKAKAKPSDYVVEGAAIPDILTQAGINPGEVFALSRNGHAVNVQLLTDLSACIRVELRRNTTGAPKSRMPVAVLSGKQSHADIVPGAGAYWYWLLVLPRKGAPRNPLIWIGPLRAGPDETNAGNYATQEDKYKFQVSRNETNARVEWNIPKGNLGSVTVKRDTKTVATSRKIILDEMREWAGQADDVLPDRNADYWYWMEVFLEDGTIITRGPVKAEYRED